MSVHSCVFIFYIQDENICWTIQQYIEVQIKSYTITFLRQIFEGLLTELGKVSAPSMLLQDFNYFFNKAIAQYINTWYTYYDQNQQTTDSLRVLKATAVLDVNKVNQYSELSNFSIGKANLFNCIYEVTLPSDYQHLLNCICVYKVNKNYKCFDAGNYAQYAATRLTADNWSRVINDYFTRPLPERPYYYIHNINGNTLVPTNPYNSSEGTGTDMNGDYSVTVDQTYTITYTQDDSTITKSDITYYKYEDGELTYYTGVEENSLEVSGTVSYDNDSKTLTIDESSEEVIENAGSLSEITTSSATYKATITQIYQYYISEKEYSYDNVAKCKMFTDDDCDDDQTPKVLMAVLNEDDDSHREDGVFSLADDSITGTSLLDNWTCDTDQNTYSNIYINFYESTGILNILNNSLETIATISNVYSFDLGTRYENYTSSITQYSFEADSMGTEHDDTALIIHYYDVYVENVNYYRIEDAVLTYGLRDELVTVSTSENQTIIDDNKGTIIISSDDSETIDDVISYYISGNTLTYKQAVDATEVGEVSNFTAQAETTGTSGNSNFKRTISLNTGDEADAVEKETAYRYGNASQIRMEIRYGNDDSLFTLQKVLIDYLKCPQYIRLTQEQMNLTEDTSQIMEFPDYVCQEITNILVKLVMENIGSARISNNMAINQTITPPAAAAVARSPQALAQSQK